MQTDLKDKWIDALKYEYAFKKGQDSLECEGKFCCLGVLQMLTLGHTAPIHSTYGEVEEEMPTYEYLDEVGLSRDDAMLLAHLNDESEDFTNVIKHIQENI